MVAYQPPSRAHHFDATFGSVASVAISRRLVDEVGPAAGRGGELLGALRGVVVLGRDLAGRRHGLERARQIAELGLVDGGELAAARRRARRRSAASILPSSTSMTVSHFFVLAGAALDQIERVAGLGGLVAAFAEQRDPALDVVGVGPRSATSVIVVFVARDAQRFEPLDHAALGDFVAAAALRG